MKAGDVITIAGERLEVVYATEKPVECQPGPNGKQYPFYCQLATVRTIVKPLAPGARDRR